VPRGGGGSPGAGASPGGGGGEGAEGNPDRNNNPTGRPSLAAQPDVDFGPYMQDLQRRIKKAWFPPRGQESRRVTVVFKIHSGGELSHLRLERSSGNASADQAALRAVENAAPFRPLPQGAPPDVDIQFTFDYNVFGGGGRGTFRQL
jgi:TonB family protein